MGLRHSFDMPAWYSQNKVCISNGWDVEGSQKGIGGPEDKNRYAGRDLLALPKTRPAITHKAVAR
eukprot:366012-Chlamydomonas_euryale.AAC.23